MMNRLIKTLLILFIITFVSNAQTHFNKQQLEEYIESAVDSFSLPGISVGITYKGETLFAEGFGVRSTITNAKVNSETLFGIASLSKAFTAASIGMLVDEGKLDWNDRVIKYLPNFRLHDSYVTNDMRICDLLSHRSGLATFDGDLLWYGSNYSREEIVSRISKMPLKNSFRAKYGYQNVMFIVAGEVINAVSGKTWEEFVQERIFKPLNMKYSTTTNKDFNNEMNVSFPHLNGEVQEWISYNNSGPAAAINSCVTDMLKWAQFWINKGIVDGDTLLSQKSYYAITKSYQALNGGKGEDIGGTHFVNTGLGWFLSDYAGRKVMMHGGGLPGFLSRIIVVPEDSLGIVIFQNDMVPLYSSLAKRVLDIFLTDKEIDYVADALDYYKKRAVKLEKRKAKVDSARVLNTEPSLSLELYQGIYRDEMYGDAEIKLKDNELEISLLPTKKLFTSQMKHWHFDTFEIKFNDKFLPRGFVTFNKNSKGKITDFTIDLPNPDFHFYNLKFIKVK